MNETRDVICHCFDKRQNLPRLYLNAKLDFAVSNNQTYIITNFLIYMVKQRYRTR